jgi:hypothetical protein
MLTDAEAQELRLEGDAFSLTAPGWGSGMGRNAQVYGAGEETMAGIREVRTTITDGKDSAISVEYEDGTPT